MSSGASIGMHHEDVPGLRFSRTTQGARGTHERRPETMRHHGAVAPSPGRAGIRAIGGRGHGVPSWHPVQAIAPWEAGAPPVTARSMATDATAAAAFRLRPRRAPVRTWLT